jgi:hypothetical protein
MMKPRSFSDLSGSRKGLHSNTFWKLSLHVVGTHIVAAEPSRGPNTTLPTSRVRMLLSHPTTQRESDHLIGSRAVRLRLSIGSHQVIESDHARDRAFQAQLDADRGVKTQQCGDTIPPENQASSIEQGNGFPSLFPQPLGFAWWVLSEACDGNALIWLEEKPALLSASRRLDFLMEHLSVPGCRTLLERCTTTQPQTLSCCTSGGLHYACHGVFLVLGSDPG